MLRCSQFVDATNHLNLSGWHGNFYDTCWNHTPVVTVHQPDKFTLVGLSDVLDHLHSWSMIGSDHPRHLLLALQSDAQTSDNLLLAGHQSLTAVDKVPGRHQATSALGGHLVGHLHISLQSLENLGGGECGVPAGEIVSVTQSCPQH